MKTSGLIGPALDFAVAKCEGYTAAIKPTEVVYTHSNGDWHHNGNWCPSGKWVQGGPIIEREGIALRKCEWAGKLFWDAAKNVGDSAYYADQEFGDAVWFGTGDTPLIAAMRCYVASKLGDEVEVPEELL